MFCATSSSQAFSFFSRIPWASCQICKIAGCACVGYAGNVFLVAAGKRSRHASGDARAVVHDGWQTDGFLWSRWRGKRSRHSRRMRNPQFYVSGKRPMDWTKNYLWFICVGLDIIHDSFSLLTCGIFITIGRHRLVGTDLNCDQFCKQAFDQISRLNDRFCWSQGVLLFKFLRTSHGIGTGALFRIHFYHHIYQLWW